MRSSKVGVGISEILKKKKMFSSDIFKYTSFDAKHEEKVTDYYRARDFASGRQTPQNLPPPTCIRD